MAENENNSELEATKWEVLGDHYKDTFSEIKEYQKRRDLLFYFIIGMSAIILFQIASPEQAANIISNLISKKLEIEKPIDFSFIDSLIWFILLGFVLRYYQTQILIERMYPYLHHLEDLLSSKYDGKAFTREGKSYLEDYPVYSRWITRIYWFLFPVLVNFISITGIIKEWRNRSEINGYLILNTLFNISIIILTVFYLYHLWKKYKQRPLNVKKQNIDSL